MGTNRSRPGTDGTAGTTELEPITPNRHHRLGHLAEWPSIGNHLNRKCLATTWAIWCNR